jgi:hypothetical protein
MNAYANLDAAIGRQAGVAFDHAVLHLDRAARSVDHAAELDENAIPSALNDAVAMDRDRRVDQVAQQCAEPGQIALLLRTGEARIARDISRENCHELTLAMLRCHAEGHALIAAGLIAFRHAGFAWTVKTYLQCYRFPDIFPETCARNLPKMRSAQKRSLSAYRRRLKRQGMIRVEVQVRKDDAALLRGIAKALADPTREAETRALLRERFGVVDAIGLKALLAAAPLEGIDLTRDRDLDRDVIV